MDHDKSFWENLYKTKDTGWDIGYASTPLVEYIDQIHDKKKHILIPGAGNAYEAEYLHKLGYQNVFILDISEQPLTNFLERVPTFPKDNLIQQNFFDHIGVYDLILEQTFFCALNKELRPNYVKKMHELLCDSGQLVGLLFNAPMNEDKPPYGGNRALYLELFSPYFEVLLMETDHNSIQPRSDKELFFKMKKKLNH